MGSMFRTFCATVGLAQGVEEVVVRGRRMSEIEFDALRIAVRNFIEQVAAPAPGRGYARWHRRVCVGVHNLANDAAQYIADRILRLAADMVDNEPRTFRPNGEDGVQLGLAALQEFAQSDRPPCAGGMLPCRWTPVPERLPSS
jgi:hypothetical protein